MVSPSPSKASPSPAVDVKKEILGGKEAEAAEAAAVVVESTDVEKKQVKKESKERKEVKKDKEEEEDVVKEEEEELEDDSDCRQLFVGNVSLYMGIVKRNEYINLYNISSPSSVSGRT